MKNFRRFMAVPVLALCTLLTFSACNNDDTEGGELPVISVQTPAVSRAGIVLPVSVVNADKIHYAVLFKAADATTDPVPETSDYKTVKVADLSEDGSLLIPATELGEQGTYVVYTYVSGAQGKTEPSMTTISYTEENFEELLKFEVKNLSTFSLDVKVDMAGVCDKYVVTVVRQTVADEVGFETNFISSSQSSISPTEAQLLDGTQSYKVFSASATIPESQLSKGTKYDSDICEGLALARSEISDTSLDPTPIKYVVAAYGIDKFGNESVYIGEPFVLPKAVYGTEPIVEITPITTLTKISADFKAPANCVKIVYGSLHTIVNDQGGISDINFWNDSNRENIIAHLQKQPLAYSPIPNGTKVLDNRREMKVIGEPGDKLVVYAYGITADGKIGPISYAIGTLQMPTNFGEASIESLNMKPSNFKLKLFWDIVYSPRTTAVRFMMTPKAKYEEYFTGSAKKELDFKWTMTTDESPDGYGWWEEFTTAELRQMNYIYSPDVNWYNTEYVIYAIARDGNGKWGKIFQGVSQTTMKDPSEGGEVEDKSVDFTKGIGKATITKVGETSKTVTDEWSGTTVTTYNTTYKISKGANTTAVYQMWFQQKAGFGTYDSFTAEKLAEVVNTRTDSDQIDFLPQPALDTEATKIGWEAPGAGYGDFLIIITKDPNGKYKIAAVLVPNHDPFIF